MTANSPPPPDDRALEIEPCPHCGGIAVHHTNVEQRRPEDWRYWVGCNKILCVSGPVCETKEAAIVAWNRLGSGGAALDAAEAENERLKAQYETDMAAISIGTLALEGIRENVAAILAERDRYRLIIAGEIAYCDQEVQERSQTTSEYGQALCFHYSLTARRLRAALGREGGEENNG